MKKTLYIVGLTLASLTAFSQNMSSLFQKEFFMSSLGEELPYRLLFPENYDSTQKYPIVLFLHGAGERGDDNEAQLKHGVSIFTTPENRKKFPAFVIAPQCPTEGYWASAKFAREKMPIDFDFNYSYEMTPALASAIELLQNFLGDPSVDTNRVYITGLSMGGMGTFEAVGRFPELFAAAAPVCGGGDAKAYGEATSKINFWIFHGDKDSVVPVENSRIMYKRIRGIGGKVTYTEYPEVDHNSWEKAYAEETFLPWMFAIKR